MLIPGVIRGWPHGGVPGVCCVWSEEGSEKKKIIETKSNQMISMMLNKLFKKMYVGPTLYNSIENQRDK